MSNGRQSLSTFQNSASNPSSSSSKISNSIESIKDAGFISSHVVTIVEVSQKARSHDNTIVSRGFEKLIEHGDLRGTVGDKEDHRRR